MDGLSVRSVADFFGGVQWQNGHVFFIDNTLVMHSRDTYVPPGRAHASLCEPHFAWCWLMHFCNVFYMLETLLRVAVHKFMWNTGFSYTNGPVRAANWVLPVSSYFGGWKYAAVRGSADVQWVLKRLRPLVTWTWITLGGSKTAPSPSRATRSPSSWRSTREGRTSS